MVVLPARRGVRLGVGACGLVSALALASCAEGTSASGDTGAGGTGDAGVPFGASIEEYQEAFADIDTIELVTQSPSPKGSVTGANVEAYFEALTEWSGGTIQVEIAFANGIAEVTEVDDALLDGRLDVGQVLPIYEPSEYPANAALIESGFISNQAAVTGTLQSNSWPNEVAFGTPEILAEFEDNGMQVLVPTYDSGANALFCSEERRGLDTLAGMVSASGGQAQSRQIEALGGSAASVAYPELFESLERGVVDCSVSSLTVGVLGGFIPAASNIVVDPEAGFAYAPGSMAMSKAVWDELPLVARQLMWDRLDVFMGVNIEGKIWPNIADAISQAKENGGTVGPFDDDARAAIQEINATMLAELRQSQAFDDPDEFVDRVEATADKWRAEVDSTGITDEADYADFDTWYSPDKVDVDEYIAHMFEEIFLPHRPS